MFVVLIPFFLYVSALSEFVLLMNSILTLCVCFVNVSFWSSVFLTILFRSNILSACGYGGTIGAFILFKNLAFLILY